MLDSYTFKPSELPKIYRIQIRDIIKDIVDSKTDMYWKNYIEFNIDEQTAISVSCIKHKVKVISTIYHREFFGEGVYKKRDGVHINHPVLEQQIDFVEKLNPKFYFISRQRTNTRWLKYYFDTFNKEYNRNLVVNDNQYWVCNGDKEGCVQTIIYPKDMKVSLKQYK